MFAALQDDDNSISVDEVDATRPTPGRRTCSKCCRVLHKYDYSKKQWSNKNDAKCRVCVCDEQDQPGKTNHLVERQKQRNITDNELETGRSNVARSSEKRQSLKMELYVIPTKELFT